MKQLNPRIPDHQTQDSQRSLVQSGHVVQGTGAKSPFFPHPKKPKRSLRYKRLRDEITKLNQALKNKTIEIEAATRKLAELEVKISKYEDHSNDAELFACLRKSEKAQLFEILNKIVADIAVFIGEGNYIGICRYRDEEDNLRGLVYSKLEELNVDDKVMGELNDLFKRMRKKVHKMKESLAGMVIATGISIFDPEELKKHDTFYKDAEAVGAKPVASLRVLMPNDPEQVLASITIYEYIPKNGSDANKESNGHVLTKRQVERLEEYLNTPSIPIIIELGATKEIERREHAKLLKEKEKTNTLLRARVRAEREDRLLVLTPIKESLPTSLTLRDGVNIFAYYDPARTIGGDFYYFSKKEGRVRAWIGDGAGKGALGAHIAGKCQYSLKRESDIRADKPIQSPKEVLSSVNTDLIRYGSLAGDRFGTCFFFDMDTENGIMTYAGAGQEFPILIKPKKDLFRLVTETLANINTVSMFPRPSTTQNTCEVTQLSTDGLPFGVMEDGLYTEKSTYLNKGDKVLFYTDGLTDIQNNDGERFGVERLIQLLEQYGSLPAEELREKIIEEVMEFAGMPKQTQRQLREISDEFGQLPFKQQVKSKSEELSKKSLEELKIELNQLLGQSASEKFDNEINNHIKESYSNQLATKRTDREAVNYFELRDHAKKELEQLPLEELRIQVAKLEEVSFEEMERREVERSKESYRAQITNSFKTQLIEKYTKEFKEKVIVASAEILNMSTGQRTANILIEDNLTESLKDILKKTSDHKDTGQELSKQKEKKGEIYHEIRSVILSFLPHGPRTDDTAFLVLERN